MHYTIFANGLIKLHCVIFTTDLIETSYDIFATGLIEVHCTF